MKFEKGFWRKRSSSPLARVDSSPSSASSSGSQTTSLPFRLFSSKSSKAKKSSRLHSRLMQSKLSSFSNKQLPEACTHSPVYSGDESGMSSDKSSEQSAEFQELVGAFRFFDSNGDGKISTSELGSALKMLGDNATEEDLRAMVKEVDSDGDGFIDLPEFIKFHTAKSGDEANSEELQAAFSVFDVDKDGLITAEELHGVLSRLGDKSLTMEDCCQMIKGVDQDGDGYVSFDEFEKMMRSHS